MSVPSEDNQTRVLAAIKQAGGSIRGDRPIDLLKILQRYGVDQDSSTKMSCSKMRSALFQLVKAGKLRHERPHRETIDHGYGCSTTFRGYIYTVVEPTA
jgi:hypothetical protein